MATHGWYLSLYFYRFLLLSALFRDALTQRLQTNGVPCEIPFVYNGVTYRDCFQAEALEWCVAIDGRLGTCREEIPSFASNSTAETMIPPSSDTSAPDCCGALRSIRFTSNLPVMIVNTRGKSIPDEPKVPGTLCVCQGAREVFPQSLIGIEIRGSTSARDFAKKSFGVETRDENGFDLDISILKYPDGSDWVFYGPEMDKSMGMRNYLTMKLYRSGGLYASRVQYFELFLQDDRRELSLDHYNGLYIFMEKIKRGNGRVPIERLSDVDISGSYIFKYDNNNFDEGDRIFNSSESGLEFIVTYPTKDKVEQASLEYLSAFIGEVEVALNSRDQSVWSSYIDEESFIDMFLITELTKNPDGYRGSYYFHKEPGSVLKAGPPWDFNEAYGMCCGYPIEGYLKNGVSTGKSGGSAISTNGWRYNICIDKNRCIVDPTDGVSFWFRVLMGNKSFVSKVQRRWTSLRNGPWSTSNVRSYFSEVSQEIPDAVERNVDRWNRELALKDDSLSVSGWKDEMLMMEEWTVSRLQWLDTKLRNPTK